jgi:hypothetical protein
MMTEFSDAPKFYASSPIQKEIRIRVRRSMSAEHSSHVSVAVVTRYLRV